MSYMDCRYCGESYYCGCPEAQYESEIYSIIKAVRKKVDDQILEKYKFQIEYLRHLYLSEYIEKLNKEFPTVKNKRKV